jgi:hypothetical protein
MLSDRDSYGLRGKAKLIGQNGSCKNRRMDLLNAVPECLNGLDLPKLLGHLQILMPLKYEGVGPSLLLEEESESCSFLFEFLLYFINVKNCNLLSI